MTFFNWLMAFEADLAGMSLEEVHQLRRYLTHPRSFAKLLDKVDRRICYLENRSLNMNQEFEKIMSQIDPEAK